MDLTVSFSFREKKKDGTCMFIRRMAKPSSGWNQGSNWPQASVFGLINYQTFSVWYGSTEMNLSEPGTNISSVEVTHIDEHGIWLLMKGGEYFLPYEHYPWFREARVNEILDVQLLHGDHLFWEALDVDLSVESLKNPEAYPLIYQ